MLNNSISHQSNLKNFHNLHLQTCYSSWWAICLPLEPSVTQHILIFYILCKPRHEVINKCKRISVNFCSISIKVNVSCFTRIKTYLTLYFWRDWGISPLKMTRFLLQLPSGPTSMTRRITSDTDSGTAVYLLYRWGQGSAISYGVSYCFNERNMMLLKWKRFCTEVFSMWCNILQ